MPGLIKETAIYKIGKLLSSKQWMPSQSSFTSLFISVGKRYALLPSYKPLKCKEFKDQKGSKIKKNDFLITNRNNDGQLDQALDQFSEKDSCFHRED